MKKITLLGSNSGRNAGDAAILSAIVYELSNLIPGVQFEVPTTHPDFILKQYPQPMVKPISVMPWNLSIRLLGLPVFNSIRRTDATLITDGIVFDYRLFNLAFNFVPSLVCLVHFAKIINKPVISFNMGVGPVTTKWGKIFTKFIYDRLSHISVRDDDSSNLLKKLGVNNPVEITADSAFMNKPCSDERADEIFEIEGLDANKEIIGFNVTSYLGSWVGGRLDPNRFKELIAETVDKLIDSFGVNVIFFGTQIMDIGFTGDLINKIKNKNSVFLIANDKYTNNEIMGSMGKIEIFAGMRLHSLILASAMRVPIVGLVYAPKVRSYLNLIKQPDRAIDLVTMNSQSLYSAIEETMKKRKEIKKALYPIINDLKNRAHESAVKLVNNYFS